MPRPTFDANQAGRLQGSESSAALSWVEPHLAAERSAYRCRPAPHLRVGTNSERQRERTRIYLLADTNPVEPDRPQDKLPAPFPLCASPPHFEKLRRIDTDRRKQVVGQRRQIASWKWNYATILFHRLDSQRDSPRDSQGNVAGYQILAPWEDRDDTLGGQTVLPYAASRSPSASPNSRITRDHISAPRPSM
jgi:hypothetical protein